MKLDPQVLSDNVLAMAGKGKPFTPGPWAMTPQDGEPRHCVLAQVWHGDKCVACVEATAGATEANANARLIAAAPHLLHVVESLIEFNKGNPHPEDENGWALIAHGLITSAQEAVAKALGRE